LILRVFAAQSIPKATRIKSWPRQILAKAQKKPQPPQGIQTDTLNIHLNLSRKKQGESSQFHSDPEKTHFDKIVET